MMNYPPTQADNSASYDDLTDMIKRLLDAAWGDDWGTFCEAFPNGREPNDVKMPVITYTLKSMKPGVINKAGAKELGARHRGTFTEEVSGNGPQVVQVFGRVIDCEVVFEVWEENNTKASKLATQFMDFMDMYKGFIKSQGVKEIIWQDYQNQTESGEWRDDIVCRSLYYFVRLEHLHEVHSDVIQKVTGSVLLGRESDDYKNETIPFEQRG